MTETIITPEIQENFLKKYGHLEGIVGNDTYYTFDGLIPVQPASGPIIFKYSRFIRTDKYECCGFKVTHVDGKAVQVSKMSSDSARAMVACANLVFGEF